MNTIRMATDLDAPALAAIYAPAVTESVASFEIVPPSESEMARRLTSVLARMPWLVYERNGRVIGYAYASRHNERAAYQWSVDVTVYVDAEHHRLGIGRSLYTSLFPLLRLQRYCAAHAGITLPNPGSVGLHESMGFRPVAVYPSVGYKHGAWRDVGYWQLPLCDRIGEPKPLLGLEEAMALPEWHRAMTAGLTD